MRRTQGQSAIVQVHCSYQPDSTPIVLVPSRSKKRGQELIFSNVLNLFPRRRDRKVVISFQFPFLYYNIVNDHLKILQKGLEHYARFGLNTNVYGKEKLYVGALRGTNFYHNRRESSDHHGEIDLGKVVFCMFKWEQSGIGRKSNSSISEIRTATCLKQKFEIDRYCSVEAIFKQVVVSQLTLPTEGRKTHRRNTIESTKGA